MPPIPHLSARDAAAIQDFVQRVRADLGTNLLELRLYGSKATGRDDPGSDIDIFVLVHEADWRLEDHVVDIAFDVNLQHGVYLSPQVVTKDIMEHPVWRLTGFLQAVETEGIPL